MNSIINELMEYLDHLLNDKSDIELFFKYLPQIISEMPHESEETPLGHVHYYSAGVFEMSAKNAVSISEFLKPFIKEIAEENGNLRYFSEYHPQKDNQPSHSNDSPDYRAVFAYQGIDELKKLCRNTGIDYDKLKKESCFHGEINSIPVFVSYSFDEFSKKGSLEFHIFDPDHPNELTEKTRITAEKADQYLIELFNNK